MTPLTLSDAQKEARAILEEGDGCHAVMRLLDRIGEIRNTAIDLLNRGTVERANVEALIEWVTVPRIQEEARAILEDNAPLEEVLTFVRKQLSELRRRAARVLCCPIVEQETICTFINHLGEWPHIVPIAARHELPIDCSLASVEL